MRLPPRAPRCLATFVLAIVIVVLPCSIATAGPIVLKFDVGLLQPGSFDYDAGIDVTGAVELNNANGTNVGGLFFDDEFVNVSSNSTTTLLAYMIQGGLADHPVADGYSTAWPLGAGIVFGNFILDQPGTLASVSVTVDQANGVARVVGAGGGSLVNGVDYFVNPFQPNTLQLQLYGLGILDQSGQTPLGLMTFNLEFVADQPPNPVPDAASSLTLFGMAMAALATHRRARRRQ